MRCHGVPGALVSVVCSNALNRAVKEFGITEPGKILDKVTDLVIETFEKSGSEVRDGMDISLWSLNTGTLALRWAGANNGLWIIPGSSANIYLSPAMKAKDGLLELSPDKQPVGKHYTRESFTTNSIQLYKGDTVYLFTDGYADQFGGGKGKKFKYSQLKQLLLSVSRKPMEEQHDILDRTFDDWRGTLSQVDDVCVAGVRI
jgi:serine phosphatase RsbU (regulator of sigma subunit)